MDQVQHESLTPEHAKPALVSASLLNNKAPRTLIYGYDVNRNSFHVYLDAGGVVHAVLYDYDGFLLKHTTEPDLTADECVPNKRAYPAACDYEFCKLLLSMKVDIPFTTFEAREPLQYYGKRVEELVSIFSDDVLPEFPVGLASLGGEVALDLSNYFTFTQWETLTRDITKSVNETLNRVYRLKKYKGEDVVSKWVDNLPGAVEFMIQQKGRENADETVEHYVLPESVKNSLKARLTQHVERAFY